jgi:hypothetical protein
MDESHEALIRRDTQRQALEEGIEILSDPDAMAAIDRGLADVRLGDVISLAEIRAELAGRRRTR